MRSTHTVSRVLPNTSPARDPAAMRAPPRNNREGPGGASIPWSNRLILTGFVLFTVSHFLRSFPEDLFQGGFHYWVYTDWLIDYSAGFTRRGLSGELLRLASGMVRPYTFAVVLSWLLFALLTVGYVRLCHRSLHRLTPMALAVLLFSPSFLLFYLYDDGALGRKEMLGYLILLAHLLLLERRSAPGTAGTPEAPDSRSYVRSAALLTAVLIPVHLLVHEASLLLFVPVHMVISWSTLRLDRGLPLGSALRYGGVLYLPVFLTFAVIFFLGRPSFEQAQQICQNWENLQALAPGSCADAVDPHMFALPGALTGLPWSFAEAASLLTWLGPAAIAAWIFVVAVLGYVTLRFCGVTATLIASERESADSRALMRHPAVMSAKYFFVPVVCSLPLYALAPDFGRWVAVACINFAMICMSREVNQTELTLARGSLLATASERHPVGRRLITASRIRPSGTAILILLLFVIFFIRLPHCCMRTAFLAEPLRSIVRDALSAWM